MNSSVMLQRVRKGQKNTRPALIGLMLENCGIDACATACKLGRQQKRREVDMARVGRGRLDCKRAHGCGFVLYAASFL